MPSSLCEKIKMKIKYKHTKNTCLYMYISTLQTYQTMCHVVRKSFCFDELHMLLEMLHLSRKVYNYT